MSRFAEVSHQEWIAAPIDKVRAQFADLKHHIAVNVHPKLRFELQSEGERRARFVQEVRLLGIRQRDVFEREIAADGSMVDTSVEGFNKGGSLRFLFAPEEAQGRQGTRVGITIRLPVPPLLGWLRPLLESQIRRELLAAVQEDKYDLEVRGYPAPGLR
ncbi:MAG TPA: SRPBCC family protein [Albitalea sp.]|nr:SRPBCC family protein [Albitalea sp.]